MTIIKIEFATPEYDEAIRLRTDILRIPLGLEFDPAQLAEEYKDIHLGCYDHHFRLIGCLVLSPVDETTIKMRQVAVAEAWQGKGVGARLVKASEVYSTDLGCTTIYCHARDTAVPFYEKLGYKKSGKQFTEVNIPHYKMIKQL